MWKNFKTFYTLAGVTLIGLAMSSICVGLYLYEPMKNKADEEEKGSRRCRDSSRDVAEGGLHFDGNSG